MMKSITSHLLLSHTVASKLRYEIVACAQGVAAAMLVVHNVAVVHRTWTPLGTVAVVVTSSAVSMAACGIQTSTMAVREARKKDGK